MATVNWRFCQLRTYALLRDITGGVRIIFMALYHLNVGYVSRSTGRSAVQSAAYITGENLYESRRDLNVNYQNRQSDITYINTFIPNGIPEEFKRLSVWDKLESFEDEYAQKRYPNSVEAREKYMQSAQTAMTVVMALPKELSQDVCRELVEEFAQIRFTSRGLIATVAIHNDEGNPHAHLQISRRSVNEKGEISWAKTVLFVLKRNFFTHAHCGLI